MVLFLNGDTDNYKRWAIKARIKRLERMIRLHESDPRWTDWQIELDNLKRDLESLES